MEGIVRFKLIALQSASKSVTLANKRKDHPCGWSFLLPITGACGLNPAARDHCGSCKHNAAAEKVAVFARQNGQSLSVRSAASKAGQHLTCATKNESSPSDCFFVFGTMCSARGT